MTEGPRIPNPQLAQVAMCAADLPGTLRFYCDGLGFVRSGSKVLWGEGLARIQGIGDDAQCVMSWLIGRQDFVQLEFFHHTRPKQKPLPPDWRPSDLGYVRFGVAVPDFDATLRRLGAFGVATLTPPIVDHGLRRACFRDPEGVLVELFEDGPSLPGGQQAAHRPFGPAIVYAAVSVPDIERSRRVFIDTLGLIDEPGLVLHTPEMEAMWGLPGARRKACVARAGDALFEIVQYEEPRGRPKPPGYLLSDQGFLNVAFGLRERDRFDAMVERALASGCTAAIPPWPGTGFAANYLKDDQGYSIEVFGCPREYDRYLGFEPEEGFGPRT